VGDETKSWTGYKKEEYLVFAEGFVVARKVYLEGLSSREDFRRQALWQFLAGSESFLSKPERRSRKLVKTFHEHTIHRVASK